MTDLTTPLWSALRDYPLMALALLGCMGFGRLILGSRDGGRNLLAGAVLIGACCSMLVWNWAGWAMPVTRALLGIGLIALGWHGWKSRASFQWPSWPVIPVLAIVFTVSLIITGDLHWSIYHYSGEDLPYFIPFQEFILADYPHPLRVATYWPAPSAIFHSVPIGTLAAINAFLPYPTLIHGVEARFILVTIVVCWTAFRLYEQVRDRQPLWQFALFMAAILVIFAVETRIVLIGSTYLYFLLLLETAIILMARNKNRDSDPTRYVAALFFLAAIAISKPVIGYVAVVTGLFLLWRCPRAVLHRAPILMGLAVIANVSAIFSRPRPFADIDLGFSIVNPFSAKQPLNYFMKFYDGLINREWLGDYIGSDVQIGIVAILMIAVAKSFWLPMAWASMTCPDKDSGTDGVLRQAFMLYIIVTSVGWIFVRNDQHGLTHQTWLLATAGALAWPALQLRLIHGWWRTKIVLIGIALIYLLPGTSPLQMAWKRLDRQGEARFAGFTWSEIAATDNSRALAPQPGEPMANVGLRAMMRGQRLLAGSVPKSYSGSFAEWILPLPTEEDRRVR